MQKNNEKFMLKALNLAAKAKGFVSPNPLVGAVVVKNNKIFGTGFHKGVGTYHAEKMALSSLNNNEAHGADIYVNLEPCSHYGKTPPCTDIIIEKGIKRVFYSICDINEKAKNGYKILQEAGIEVFEGLLREKAFNLNKYFFKWHLSKKPYVILKSAISLDGKVATKHGESQWISSDESRAFVHKLRAEVDAVLVATGTCLKDNPKLSARPIDKYKQPKRVLVDSFLKTPSSYNIFDANMGGETIVFCGSKASETKREELLNKGIIVFKNDKIRYPLEEVMEKLGELEIQSVLVEPGAQLAESFLLKSDLVDLLHLFIAPKLIGGVKAPGFLGGAGIEKLCDAKNLEILKTIKVGTDLHLTLRPQNGFSIKMLEDIKEG